MSDDVKVEMTVKAYLKDGEDGSAALDRLEAAFDYVMDNDDAVEMYGYEHRSIYPND